MPRLLQLLTVTVLLLLSLAARATTDGGRQLQLLAVAGPGERFAIMLEQNVQEDCTIASCTVFAIDVKAGSERRLHEHGLLPPRRAPAAGARPAASPLKRYLHNLDESARRHLTPIRDARKDARLSPDVRIPVDPNDHEQLIAPNHTLRFTLAGKQRIYTTLSHSAPFTAAAVYDRRATKPDDWRQCIDARRQVAMCSSCKRITLQVDGAPCKVWSCPGLGRYSGAAQGSELCDCRAKGHITTLMLRHQPSGAMWRGGSIVAVPSAMGQNFMGNDDDLTLEFGHPRSGADMKVVALRSGLLMFGTVVNARTANGTYIPLLATAPSLRSRSISP